MRQQVKCCLLISTVFLFLAGCEARKGQVASPVKVVAPSEMVSTIALTEGPAADAEGNVYFSDIFNNRIMKWNPGKAETEVFRQNSGRSNGLVFDRQGRLVACEGGGPGGNRRLTRTDLRTNAVTVLADRYQGKRFNSPNDLSIDSKGRIYFTDPRYGSPEEMALEDAVYRVEEQEGKISITRVLGPPEVDRPNGILISPDDQTLYVVNHNAAPGRSRKVLKFDVQADGTLTNRRMLFDFAPGRGADGMAMDREGNLYVAAGTNIPQPTATTVFKAGVYIFSPEDELMGLIPVSEGEVTNCAFGGPELKTLYITAGRHLYHARVNVRGRVIFPPASE